MKLAVHNSLTVALLWSVLLALVSLPATAQDCPELLGRWPYGPAGTVAVSGSTAYVGSGTVLLVIDVSNPGAPQLLGEVVMPDLVRGVAIAGDHAYVAVGYPGLRVVDVSVPSAPVEVGLIDTPGYARAVVASGNYAYVADGSVGGLRVISIANPLMPAEAGFLDTPGSAVDVVISGSHAYLAEGSSGLRVISVANASEPVEVGLVDTPGYAQGVAVAGSYAYVADGASGLRVIAVTDPSTPVESGFFDTRGTALDVAVAGGLAFVADDYSHVQLVDVSTPAAPSERGILANHGKSIGVAVAGGFAFVAGDYEGLVIGEFSDPDAPTRVGSYQTAGYSSSIAVAGDLAYVGIYGPYGLRVLDLATPPLPLEVGWVDLLDSPQQVVISGGHAFVPVLNAGLQVLDLGRPLEPVPVGLLDTPGEARGVAVVGTTAYVADGSSGLRVVDVSNPTSPVEMGFVDTPGVAYAVAVEGNRAYVADQSAGLRIIDIGNPTAPTEVGFVDTQGMAYAVEVTGDHAYVADAHFGLRVIDVSSPSAPEEVGSYDTNYSTLDVAVIGDLAYLAEGGGGLLVLDVSNPAAPELVGSSDTPGQARSLTVSDGRVVVTDYDAGVSIFADCQGGSPPGHESFVPAAAVAAGAQGAFFSTDLELNNTGTLEARVDIAWLPRGEDNAAPVQADTIILAPGRSVRFANVLGELFDLGPDSFGALRLVATTADVIAMSRTYNSPDGKAAGTFGQGLPAIPAAEMIAGAAPQRIIFLSENPDSRANVGCVNGSAEPVRVSLAVFNDKGARLETRTMDLGPYSNDQVNRILRSWAPVNGYVDVSGDGAAARYYCYGSMLDNLTSDPTTILPQTPSAEVTFIPAAALAAGLEGAFFQTDVDLNNSGSTAISYQLLWLPRGADNSNPARSEQFSLAPGAGVRYANVLDEVFGLEPDRVGALAVEAKSPDLLAMSRTYNLPSGKTAGTFGQELAGIPADRMIPTGVKKRIIFMDENDDVRANIGCVNGSDGPITVNIQLFSPQGALLETKTMNLPPRSNDQITRVFRSHAPITGGYVDVSTPTPGVTFTCYGSVLDNQTSDPTTVLPH